MKTFTTDDLYLTEELIKVSSSIAKLFDMLCDLEINGKKDTIEYQKTLDYLKIALSVEEDIYKNNNLNSERCNEIIDFIIMSMLTGKMINDFDAVSTSKFDNSAIRRIINILNKKNIMDYAGISKIITASEYEDRYVKDLQDIMFVNNLMRSYLLDDLVNAIMCFNDEEIKKEENDNYRDSLIKAKYFLSSIYKELDDSLLNQKFESCEKILDNTRIMAYITGLNNDNLIEIKREYLSKLAIKQIYMMLSTKNKDSLLIRKSILRACLMLMNDDILYDVNDFFTRIINASDNVYDENNVGLIKNCFINAHSDMNKQITLKLS